MKAKDTVIKQTRKRVEVPSVLGGRLFPQIGSVSIEAELLEQAEISFNLRLEDILTQLRGFNQRGLTITEALDLLQ